MARERSESLRVPVLFHILSVPIAVLARGFLP
jgi:hypothetical protein